jgi:hypothetical protein
MSNYISLINIPAYDATNKGLIIKVKLTINPNRAFSIETRGGIAAALKNNFHRIIEIMGSLKQSWECLESINYLLECKNDRLLTKDAKSSSMALSIALINACRAIHDKPQRLGLSGTGILRMDGSFDKANLEDTKYAAAKHRIKSLKKFITPHECKHLFSLEKLINHYQ